jgi:hypothetical protein
MYWINAFLYVFLTTNPNFIQRLGDIEIIKMILRTIVSFGNLFTLPQASKNLDGDIVKKLFYAFAITIPLFAIVTLLLSSADQVFSDLIKNIGETIVPDMTILNIFSFIFACILTFIGLSYVIGLIKYSNKNIIRVITDARYHADLIIPSIISYSLNIVYLAFVYIQFKYLFGGSEYAASQGIIYSEYAIKGFWEMIIVCFINFVILYFLIGKFSLSTNKAKSIMLPSYILMIVSSAIMVYSSHVRLSVYENGYGFSIDRLIPHSFLVFMAMVLILMAVVLAFKDNMRNKLLLLGIFILVNIFVAGFAIFPMEKFIVRQNISRAAENKDLDKKYLVVDLGLEGFNEVLTQVKQGKLEKELLMSDYIENLIREDLDSKYAIPIHEDIYNYERSFESDREYSVLYYKTERLDKIKNAKWQSWNIEYTNFKNLSEEMLNNKDLCLNKKITCDML